MAKATWVNVSKEIAELLGLNPNDVGEITIRIRPENVITADVQILPTEHQMETLMEIIKRYKLRIDNDG